MALFSLVVAIPLLIPFADLGIGGAVTELVARWRTGSRRETVAAIRKAALTLLSVSILLLVAATAIFALQAWPTVLGIVHPDANLAGFLVVVLFALSVPVAIGYRVLLGLQLNRHVVLIQSSASIVGYSLAAGAALIGMPLWFVAAVPGLMLLSASILATMLARQRFLSVSFASAQEEPGESSGVRLRSLAWPMALIAVSVPVAYQSDRLILGHLSSPLNLAVYAAAFQLYAPLNSVVTTAGQSLWPKLTALRTVEGPSAGPRIFQISALFGAVALPVGIALVVLGPMVSSWSTNGQAGADSWMFMILAALLVVNAINYPFGMFLMGGPGLPFQAICIAVMALCNVGLSVVLTPVMGAAGPVVASVTSIVAIVLVPCVLFVRRQLSDRAS